MAKKKISEMTPEELAFEIEMAEVVWQKVKGISVPESYSVEDRVGIVERYWHRAMNKESYYFDEPDYQDQQDN